MYKDKEKQKEVNRERVRRYREKQKGVTSEGVTEEGVTPPVTPSPVDGWPDVKAFIERESLGMPNLERLQRIAGSLREHKLSPVGGGPSYPASKDVWFGVSGLTMEDIGSVIGTKEGKYAL